MKILFQLLIIVLPLAANAAIYKYVDNNGNVSYSDKRRAQAQIVRLPQINSYQLATPAMSPALSITTSDHAATANQQKPSDEPINYGNFTITSLINNQTFQNQRQIPVDITITPKLEPNDIIELLLDGNTYSRQSSTRFMLENIDRGVHIIQARLVNATGQVLKTTAVFTIYVHYAKAPAPVTPPAS